MSDRKETLIEEGTEFKGAFASDCPIVVKGRIEGEITAPSMVVSQSGSVSGTVKVKELRSEGELAGEYDADAIYLSGSVKDNTVIRARVLEVKLAPERGRMQVIFGECDLEVGDVPSKEEAVAAAKSADPSQPPAAPSERPQPIGQNGEKHDSWSVTGKIEAEAELDPPGAAGTRRTTQRPGMNNESEPPAKKESIPPPLP